MVRQSQRHALIHTHAKSYVTVISSPERKLQLTRAQSTHKDKNRKTPQFLCVWATVHSPVNSPLTCRRYIKQVLHKCLRWLDLTRGFPAAQCLKLANLKATRERQSYVYPAIFLNTFFCHFFPHIFPLSFYSVSCRLASFCALNMSVYIREVDFLRSLANI